MFIVRALDSPYVWGLAGLAIGLVFGVTSISVWMLALGLGLFVLYLRVHGTARHQTETYLFAGGPAFLISWLIGFIIRSFVF